MQPALLHRHGVESGQKQMSIITTHTNTLSYTSHHAHIHEHRHSHTHTHSLALLLDGFSTLDSSESPFLVPKAPQRVGCHAESYTL